MKILVCLFGALICLVHHSFGQIDSSTNNASQFPNRIFAKINNRSAILDNALARQTDKYLARLARKEKKIQNRLYKIDSNAAKNLFSGSQEKYTSLAASAKDTSVASKSPPREYIPYADSVKSMLLFAKKDPNLLNASTKDMAEIDASITHFNKLQNNLDHANKVNEFIRERKQMMKDRLKEYVAGSKLGKYLDEYNKQAYYYSEELKEFKETMSDPDKMEKLALGVMEKLPAFQEFLKNNCMLASLFPAPANMGSQLALSGLQSRSMIQQVFQAQISAGGSNAQNVFSQGVQDAESKLSQLRDRILKYGSSGTDIDDPSFKPNQQHTKTFLQRLEYGLNIQTTQSSNYFPVTTDVGLSIGYKINDKATAGLGGSFNVGWGSAINHIKLSTQGGSLRTFFEIKAKGSFYFTGGLEDNLLVVQAPAYQQVQKNSWQQSGLVGLSKIVNIKSSIFSKTKIQLLWDFLSYSQIPRSQPFKFRAGYVF